MVWETNSGAVVGGRFNLKDESINLLKIEDFPTPSLQPPTVVPDHDVFEPVSVRH